MMRINALVLGRLASFTHGIVEGIGGWLVPIARGLAVREWASELGLPVLVIARAGLGTLNHTLLTVESIRQAGLDCPGIVMNAGAPEIGTTEDIVRESNPEILTEITGLPVYRFEKGENPGKPLPHWLGGS
jgi:dethiobiotin synthetase